jgi:hypothetical protein
MRYWKNLRYYIIHLLPAYFLGAVASQTEQAADVHVQEARFEVFQMLVLNLFFDVNFHRANFPAEAFHFLEVIYIA